MDPELLARIQFAFTIAFHYIFPPISIGLGLILVFMEGMYLKTRNPDYEVMTKFWVKVFALVFAVGVATGIVMEFEFGTNWATYSRYVGDIFGSALAAEGIFAFFLESGFLAILVFGWNRVKPPVHFFATIMVALGSTLSAVWIIVANSWQQTPAGYVIEGAGTPQARAVITDFWAMVFNPSSMDRLSHTVVGAWATGAFLVISVAAYYYLKGIHLEFAKNSLRVALPVAIVSSLLQPLIGHVNILMVGKHQPAKLAAFEGHYDTAPMDLYLFGWTDQNTQKTVGVKIPGMASFLIDGNFKSDVKGLNEVAPTRRDQPQVNAVFQVYHLMIGVGMVMIGVSLLAGWLFRKGTLQKQQLLLKVLVASVVLPHLANQAGWFAAEMGRQPWIVYNQLRTSDAFSKSVKGEQILASLVLFALVYSLLFALFLYLLNKKIQLGPGPEGTAADSLDRGVKA